MKKVYLLVAGCIVFVFGSAISALIGELKTVVSYVSGPLRFFADTLKPAENTPDFLKVTYAAACLILYLHIAGGLLQAVSWASRSFSGKEKAKNTQIGEDLAASSYSEEIAAAIEVIEKPGVLDDDIQIELDDLMKEIGRSISKSFPEVDYRNIRHCFITQDLNGEIVMMRLGRQMILKPEDAEIVDWVLTSFYESHVLVPIPANKARDTEMKAVGLVRNAGTVFKLGFVILLPTTDILTEDSRGRFYNRSLSIPLIAHIDKLMQHMVKYTMKMRGGSAQ